MSIIEEATMKSIQGTYKKLPDLNGMTLRDVFAMNALQGLIASDTIGIPCEKLAKQAYEFADAMLEVREVQND